MKKIIIAVLVALLAVILVYGYLQYKKTHPDYKKMKAEMSVTAEKLFYDYRNNTSKSDSIYLGKMIEVEGIVNYFEMIDSLVIVIFVFDKGVFGDEGVRCTLIPGSIDDFDQIQSAANIKLKGLCQGYNETDVILEKCSIIN
jgi:hypothetical protein